MLNSLYFGVIDLRFFVVEYFILVLLLDDDATTAATAFTSSATEQDATTWHEYRYQSISILEYIGKVF